MPRENAQVKATRLLVEARVQVVRLDDSGCLAFVRGDSGAIRVVRNEAGFWTCDCPAYGPCSHATATARVVRVKEER
jgi:hypothetical protein